MGVSNGDEDGGGVDGDGSGSNSLSRQGAETETSIPQIRVDDGGGSRAFHGFLSILLGYTPRGLFMVLRVAPEGSRVSHTMFRRGQI